MSKDTDINIYKQGMASKCEGYYEDPHNGYVVEIATEDMISASFDYDRDTIEDVFLKLIEPNEFGTSDTHYLKTVAGRVLQDNSSTLISVNKGRPIDTSAIFFMPELFFELCPRFGPLANEPSYSDSPTVKRYLWKKSGSVAARMSGPSAPAAQL